MESHEVEEIKRHFDVVAESLRADIKTIAEGHIILNRKIDTLREQNEREHKELRQDLNILREQNEREHKELRQDLNILREQNEREHEKIYQEMNTLCEQNEKEHKEILSEVKSSYGDLNHRVSILEDK